MEEFYSLINVTPLHWKDPLLECHGVVYTRNAYHHRHQCQERRKIEEQAVRCIQEQHRLKDAEKDKKLQDALAVNEELRRKLQQGSQPTQGEVLELKLEEQIWTTFPFDQIEPVPKGMNGADVIQRLHNKNGHCCGAIVWESKRTKGWCWGAIQSLTFIFSACTGVSSIL